MVKISGFGIEFIPLNIENLDLLYKWRNDSKIIKYMDDTREVSFKVLIAWFNKIKSSCNYKAYIAYRNGQPFGFSQFYNINYDNKSCYCGSYLSPDLLNSGLYFFSFLLRERVLKNLKIDDIYTEVRKINKRSQSIQESLGAKLIDDNGDFFVYKIEKESRGKNLAKYASMLGVLDEFNATFKNYF